MCTFAQKGETFYFVNLLGIGFVTDVAQTATRFLLTGDLSYVIGI
jgi:diacylglycerol kinase family enzyme